MAAPNRGFLVGAVTGFVTAGLLAHGSAKSPLGERQSQSVRLWGGVHIVPIAAAIGFTSLVCAVIGGAGAWLVIGFSGTLIYLLGVAGQFMIADAGPQE